MSKTYEILFSTPTSAEELAQLRAKHVATHRARLTAQGVDPSNLGADYYKEIEEQYVTKDHNEKLILKSLFQAVTKKEKELSVFNEMADNVAQVDDCTTNFKISSTDLKRIQEAFKEMPEQFKVSCFRFPELMKQLEKPKEVE
jgi:hypothetical protein